jgi:hypothetical protein
MATEMETGMGMGIANKKREKIEAVSIALHKTQGTTKIRRRYLFLTAIFVVLSLLSPVALYMFLSPQHGRMATLTVSRFVNVVQEKLASPPNMLKGPLLYDTRLCVQHPSSTNCDGRYPVMPEHISPQLSSQNGWAECMDRKNWIGETQNIVNGVGNVVGLLQLRWLPACKSYYGYVNFNFPLNQVQEASIWVQTERYSWGDKISKHPPFFTRIEQTGPVKGSNLTRQELYSPLIYSPSDPVSATIDIKLIDGSQYGNFTDAFFAGSQQQDTASQTR